MKVRAHLMISGDVQGVFFRSSTRSQAKICSVTGWIRNLPDGRVEAVAEGNKENVERLIEFCRKGPPGSRVDDVKVTWEKPSHRYSSFDIRV